MNSVLFNASESSLDFAGVGRDVVEEHHLACLGHQLLDLGPLFRRQRGLLVDEVEFVHETDQTLDHHEVGY